MKIGEARERYSAQIKSLRNRKQELEKQKEEMETGVSSPEEREAVILELSEVQTQYDKTREFMGALLEREAALMNAESAKQQGEAMAKGMEDMAKCMEVARRIAKGGTVPPKDEQKLMEYSMEMYMSAKNLAFMNKLREKEEYESLWDDEEEQSEGGDVREEVEGRELDMELPEISAETE